MPELPEVETTKRGIEPYLTDKNFKSIEIRNNKLRIPFNVDLLDFITKKKIIEIQRRAKYITIEFSNGYSLLIHLGMTGNLRVTKSKNFQKHDHLIFKLSSGNSLVFNDVRRFGLAQIFKKKDGFYLLDNNGPDPFENAATNQYFYNKVRTSSANIKSILLNHKIISGIVNIYASEILFSSCISPLRTGKKISKPECSKILTNSRKILKRAIKAGGTTLNDYYNADSKPGYFKIKLNVYDCEGQNCKKCKTKIKRIVQSNRSTYFCPKCQKI